MFAAIRSIFGRVRAWTGVELPTLVILGVSAGALAAFIQIAEEVVEGDTKAFDKAILLALRNPLDHADPIGPWWVEAMFKDITAMGSVTILTLVTVIAVGYLAVERKRNAALLVSGSIIGGMLVSTLLKNAFARPRPDLVAHLVDVRTLSFPSGHAMLSAVTFLTLGALLARVTPDRRGKVYLMSVAVILTLLIGISRVFLGVHYPTDVLAGWCAGAAWAAGCWLLAIWLQALGKIERPGESDADGPRRTS